MLAQSWSLCQQGDFPEVDGTLTFPPLPTVSSRMAALLRRPASGAHITRIPGWTLAVWASWASQVTERWDSACRVGPCPHDGTSFPPSSSSFHKGTALPACWSLPSCSNQEGRGWTCEAGSFLPSHSAQHHPAGLPRERQAATSGLPIRPKDASWVGR